MWQVESGGIYTGTPGRMSHARVGRENLNPKPWRDFILGRHHQPRNVVQRRVRAGAGDHVGLRPRVLQCCCYAHTCALAEDVRVGALTGAGMLAWLQPRDAGD